MTFLLGVEIAAVLFSLLFLFLLIRENIWCWLFGILSSLLSIYLFIESRLYSEAILYFYYVITGIYGVIIWRKRPTEKPLPVVNWPVKVYLYLLVIGFFGSLGLGTFFKQYSNAANPYPDAFSTIFSFIATYLEVHKVLSAWIFWIFINLFSIWLYASRDLYIYSALMVVYFVFSIVGYWNWKGKLDVRKETLDI